MRLDLDTTFQPYTTEKTINFESFVFSGGEPHLKILDKIDSDEVTITYRINSFNDFGLLLLAIDALQRMTIEKISVLIPYFPAARQDRLMIKGEPLSVKVYTEILNAQNLHKITVFDAHSEVTPALLNNCENVNNHSLIEKVCEQFNDDLLLISPDGGALKKIYKVAAHLQNYEVIECSKSRDVKTGKLSGFQVYADDLQGKDCLIVDDICDGGGTFLGLAKELKAKNAGDLYLAVSHGIFSKGFDALSEHFKTVFTTDSFRNIEHPLVKQIKLNELL